MGVRSPRSTDLVPVVLIGLGSRVAIPHVLDHGLGILAVILIPVIFLLIKRRAEKRWSPCGWLVS
jgi:hypothetical protein